MTEMVNPLPTPEEVADTMPVTFMRPGELARTANARAGMLAALKWVIGSPDATASAIREAIRILEEESGDQ